MPVEYTADFLVKCIDKYINENEDYYDSIWNRNWRNRDNDDLPGNVAKKLPYEELLKFIDIFLALPADSNWHGLTETEEEYNYWFLQSCPIFTLEKFSTAIKDERVFDLVNDKYRTFEDVFPLAVNPKYVLSAEGANIDDELDYHAPFQGVMNYEHTYDNHRRNGKKWDCGWWNKERFQIVVDTYKEQGWDMDDYKLSCLASRFVTLQDHMDSIVNDHTILPWSLSDNIKDSGKTKLFNAIVEHADEIAAVMNEGADHNDVCTYSFHVIPNSYSFLSDILKKKLTKENLNALSKIEPNLRLGENSLKKLYGTYGQYIKRIITQMTHCYSSTPNPVHMRCVKNKYYRLSAVTSVALPPPELDASEYDTTYLRNLDIECDAFDELIEQMVKATHEGGVRMGHDGKLAWLFDGSRIVKAINNMPAVKEVFDSHMAEVNDSEKKTVAKFITSKLEFYTKKKVMAKLGDPKTAPIHLINNLAEVELEDNFMHRFEHFCSKFGLELNDIPGMVEDLIEKKSQEMA